MKRRKKPPPTERSNPRTRRIDRLTSRQVVELLNVEDARVPAAVRRTLPQVARAVEAIVEGRRTGRRLFYVGAGTSGRLGVLDAAECPPTFQVSPRRVQAILAGGRKAMFHSSERDLTRKGVRKGDVVVVLTASGTTPYALGALRYARRRGAITVAVAANRRSLAARGADIAICPDTGPEAIAGSTRLKAGTAQKLVLNMLSTASMIRLGHVYHNLRARGRRILTEALGVTDARAARLVGASGGNLKVAILMGRLGCSRREAERRTWVKRSVASKPPGRFDVS
jgi:N-acetylmuramic acid 6-phosphate etherase